LLDERVDLVFSVKIIIHVLKFIYLRHWFSIFTFWTVCVKIYSYAHIL
jgi:hypothetical protein